MVTLQSKSTKSKRAEANYEVKFHQKDESRVFQLLTLIAQGKIDSALKNSENFVRKRQ